MDQDRKKELLKKFAERTLSPSEEQEFFEMAASGEHLSLLDDDIDLEISGSMDVPDSMEQSLNAIKNNVSSKVGLAKRKPLNLTYRVAASIAAVLFIFVGVKGFQYYSYIMDTKTFITIEAELGKTLRVVLPDSTIVTVSSGSVLRYPKAFPSAERRVHLKVGEAFFQVTRNPEQPFHVESGKFQTTALGTSFTVEYNPVFRWGKVNLYTGKVSVRETVQNSMLSAIILSPGNTYEYLDGKLALSTFTIEPGNPVEKGLVFERSSFRDAVHRIASWHKVNIIFDGLDTQKLSVNGDFNGLTIEEILQSIAFINKIQFTKTDNLTYTFMKE